MKKIFWGRGGNGNGKEKEGGSVWHKKILGLRAIYPIVLPSILLLFQMSTLKQIIYIKKNVPYTTHIFLPSII